MEQAVVHSRGGELISAVDRFSEGLKTLRNDIEQMSNEELLELYDKLKAVGVVSWVVRCIVLGTVSGRAKRGDGALKQLAKEFGIGVRMAEMDVAVYEAFIRDDPEFEAKLPPAYYQKALKAKNPKEAIEYALERVLGGGGYTATEFDRQLKGELPREPFPEGLYRCVPVEAGEFEEQECSELFGSFLCYSKDGELYVRTR